MESISDLPPDTGSDLPPDINDPSLARRDARMALINQAARGAFTRPYQAVKGFMTNPQQQANAMPGLMGTAGAFLGPGGMTVGATGGDILKQLATTALGNNPNPTTTSSLAEMGKTAGGALVGEGLGAAVNYGGKLLSAGSRIGAAEKAAGVVTKASDRYPTSGNVGEYLNTLESQLDASLSKLTTPKPPSQETTEFAPELRGMWGDIAKNQSGMSTTAVAPYVRPDLFQNAEEQIINDPTTAKTAKDIADYIQQNPNLVGKSNLITVQAQRVSSKASKLLNQMVPGRQEAAQDFATLMKYLGPAKALQSLAQNHAGAIATGLGFGTGAGIIAHLLGKK